MKTKRERYCTRWIDDESYTAFYVVSTFSHHANSFYTSEIFIIVNPLEIGNTPLCGERVKTAKGIIMYVNISLRLSRNSEAFASEFLENLNEMFPRYL